jgi:hypothetical protein
MPIDPTKRIANWNEKYNVERVTAILTEKRPAMLQNVSSVVPLMTAMELQVKQTCDAQGAPTIQYPFYLCFGREMWKLTRQDISGESMAQAAATLIAKWVSRGLQQTLLEAIRSEVFNVPAPASP